MQTNRIFQRGRRDRHRRLRKEDWTELPHLHNVFRDSRLQRSDISIFDYDEDWRDVFVHHEDVNFDRDDLNAYIKDLEDLLLSRRPECRTRIILVEDLCSELMEILYRRLDLSVEFFEEHLINSGWNADQGESSPSIDSECPTWNSRRVRKNYASMKWFRPYSTNHPNGLLNIGYRSLDLETSTITRDDDIETTLRSIIPESNVWRRHLNLRVEGDLWSFDKWSSSNVIDQTPVATEERVTVWQGPLRNSGIVIILALIDGGLSSALSKRTFEPSITVRRALMRKPGDRNVRLETIGELRDSIVYNPPVLDVKRSKQEDRLKTDRKLVFLDDERQKSEMEKKTTSSHFRPSLQDVIENEEHSETDNIEPKGPHHPTCEDASTHDSDINEYVSPNPKHPHSDEILTTDYGSSQSQLGEKYTTGDVTDALDHDYSKDSTIDASIISLLSPQPSKYDVVRLGSLRPNTADIGRPTGGQGQVPRLNPSSRPDSIKSAPEQHESRHFVSGVYDSGFVENERSLPLSHSEPNLALNRYSNETALPTSQNFHQSQKSFPVSGANSPLYDEGNVEHQEPVDDQSEQSDAYGGTPRLTPTKTNDFEISHDDLSDFSIKKSILPSPAIRFSQSPERDKVVPNKPPHVTKQTIRSVPRTKSKSKRKSEGDGLERSYFYPQPRSIRYPLFINVATRGPAQYANLKSALRRGFFAQVTTTREDICSWLEFDHYVPSPRNFVLGPMFCIFELMTQDTYDFLQLTDAFLDGVVAASDDESKLQKHIVLWRTMLNILSRELRYMTEAIPPFAIYLLNEVFHDEDDQSGPVYHTYWRMRIDVLHGRISEGQNRIQQAYTFLASSASISESRRGISEAESVSRLTELAFIYIPLSFAATFFSMQVKELEQSTTTIWGFVGLGLGVTLTSYGTRLFIRSRWYKDSYGKMISSIRRDSGTRDGQPIPSTSFVLWIWHVLFRDPIKHTIGPWKSGFGITLALTACGLFPMISIWASGAIVKDIKTVISVMMVFMFSIVVVLYFLFNVRAIESWFRGLRKRRQRRKQQRSRIRQTANV